MTFLANFPLFPFFFMAAAAVAVFSLMKYRLGVWKARRRGVMEAIATAKNLRPLGDAAPDLAVELKEFDLFDRLDLFKRSRVSDVLQASVGFTDVFLFDYTYVVSAGNTSKRVSQTVFFAKDRRWSLPNFKLKPEGWWHKIQQLFGKKDINFSENPDFNEKWWLTGEFEAMIRESFSPEVRHFFEENPPMTVEGNNFYLVAYKPKKVLDEKEGAAFYERCVQLMQLLQTKEQQEELLRLAEIKLPETQRAG